MKVIAILGGLGSQMIKYSFYFSILMQANNDDIYINTFDYLKYKRWNGYELDNIFGLKPKNVEALFSKKEKEQISKSVLDHKIYILNKITKLSPNKKTYYYYRGKRKKWTYLFNINHYFYLIFNLTLRYIKKIFIFIYLKISHSKDTKKIFSYKRNIDSVEDSYDKNYKSSSINVYYDEFNHNSDTYIREHKASIKRIFTFPIIKDKKNLGLLSKIINCKSIALHVRRTDHLYDNSTILSEGYYKKAVSYIKNKVKRPVFFIFSDDYIWVSKNLNILGLNEKYDSLYYINWNRGRKSYIDMQLMTYCKHNILAISSFGWWGYYLSKRRNKIVCAPKGYWTEVPNHF